MKNKNGFTLIEVLVAVSVFSLVIVIALGLFTNIIRSQRKSVALQNVQENGRYLIDFMAKEIRMSEITSVDGSSLVLAIDHPLNGSIQYSFSGGQLTREDSAGVVAINSDETQVDGSFIIYGKTLGDNIQPRVRVILKAQTTGSKTEEQSVINLQTTISQRPLD